MDWRAFTVAVEGASIAGEVRGEPPALALLHGFGGDRHGWDAVTAALPPALGLLRYDQRGFGESAQAESIAFSHAEDLLALLDARGIKRIALAGLSQGGAIAAHFALEHPERVDKLILVAPALMGWEWSDEWRGHWRAMVRAARSGDMDGARALWWQHPLFATCRSGDAGAMLRCEIERFAGCQWIADPQHPVLPDVERLHELAMPVLLLTGGRDMPDFQLIASLLEASAPDLRRVDFADAGHMLPLERPADVAREIAAFLSGEALSPSPAP